MAAAPSADAVDSHCSGLIKLTADKSELFAAQVSWTEFVDMLRVYKRYDLQFTSYETWVGGVVVWFPVWLSHDVCWFFYSQG
jgi:hypothetical protein